MRVIQTKPLNFGDKVTPGIYTGVYESGIILESVEGRKRSLQKKKQETQQNSLENIQFIQCQDVVMLLNTYHEIHVFTSTGVDITSQCKFYVSDLDVIEMVSNHILYSISENKTTLKCVYKMFETDISVTILDFNRDITWNFVNYNYLPVDIGNLTNEESTDSYLYASNHGQEFSEYGFKELIYISDDDNLNKKPVNVSYSIGPINPDISENYFNTEWCIYSDVSKKTGTYLINLNTNETRNLATMYPLYSDFFNKSHGIISSVFDMSGSLVIATESNINEITSLRQNEGFNNWEGYSPLAVCNISYVPQSNPFNLAFDTVILYLKDIDNTTIGWNYDSIRNFKHQLLDSEDKRKSRTIYARFQRNNFDTEYILCTTDFDISYIENAWFNGNPNEATPPDDIGREYKLYISVRDSNRNRHTLTSSTYYTFEYSYVSKDKTQLSASLVDGDIFDVIITTDSETDTVDMSTNIANAILFDTINRVSTVPDTISGITNIANAELFNTVYPVTTTADTTLMTTAINDSTLYDQVVKDNTIHAETVSASTTLVSGILEII